MLGKDDYPPTYPNPSHTPASVLEAGSERLFEILRDDTLLFLSVVILTDHEGVGTGPNSCCGAHTSRLNMYTAVLILMVVQHLTRWKQDPGSEQPFEILRDDTPLF